MSLLKTGLQVRRKRSIGRFHKLCMRAGDAALSRTYSYVDWEADPKSSSFEHSQETRKSSLAAHVKLYIVALPKSQRESETSDRKIMCAKAAEPSVRPAMVRSDAQPAKDSGRGGAVHDLTLV